jgi:hypothetical protein
MKDLMLNYVKVVLQKVSFDNLLFEKELRKAITWIASNEIEDLKMWSYQMYGHIHGSVIEKCFEALL